MAYVSLNVWSIAPSIGDRDSMPGTKIAEAIRREQIISSAYALATRGGLRARILTYGWLAVGDAEFKILKPSRKIA